MIPYDRAHLISEVFFVEVCAVFSLKRLNTLLERFVSDDHIRLGGDGSLLKVECNYLFSILELSRVDRLPPPEKATEHRISAPLTQQVGAQAAVEEAMVRRTLSGLVLA